MTEAVETAVDAGAPAPVIDAAPATDSAAAPANGAAVTGKPDWAPDKFWDAEKGELRTETMAKSYHELAKRLSDLAAPREHKLNLPEFAENLGIFVEPDCPLATSMLEVAKEVGMPQKHLDAVVKGWAASFERAREHEMGRLLKDVGGDQAALDKRLGALRDQGHALFGPGSPYAVKNGLSDAQAKEAVQVFRQMASAASSVKMLEFLLSPEGAAVIGGTAGVPSAAPATDVPTMDEVLKLQASGEYKRGDKATVQRVNDAYARMARAGKI